MRTWTRTPITCRCGRCGELIAVGSPMVTVAIPGVSRPLRRCQTCAGGAPPDLPALVERTVAQPVEMARVGTLAFDYKAAQVGREPGEDDA